MIAGSYLRELSYTHNHTEEGESRGNVAVVSQFQNSMTTVAVGRANFTTESRFRSQAKQCGKGGGIAGSTSVSPYQYHSTSAPYSIIFTDALQS